MKKHLGVWHDWKIDPVRGERYIKATIPKLVDEIVEAYTKYKGS